MLILLLMNYEDTDLCCLDGKAMYQARTRHMLVFVCWKFMAIGKQTYNIDLYVEKCHRIPILCSEDIWKGQRRFIAGQSEWVCVSCSIRNMSTNIEAAVSLPRWPDCSKWTLAKSAPNKDEQPAYQSAAEPAHPGQSITAIKPTAHTAAPWSLGSQPASPPKTKNSLKITKKTKKT